MIDISVVIPAWDLDPSFLEQSIKSLLSQSEPCQVLIVDNHSSQPIAQFEGTRVVRLDNRVSVGQARNEGLKAVETPYVMFMDADDVLLEGALAKLRRMFERVPRASIAAGRIMEWNPDTGQKQLGPWPVKWAGQISRWPAFFQVCNAIQNMTPITGCALIRTSAAQDTLGFSDATAEDWTFGVSLTFRGRVVLTKDPVKLYRWRSDSLSQQVRSDWKALYIARRTTRQRLRIDPAVPRWMKWWLPVLAILHLFEIPLHVRREKAAAARKAS